MKRRELEEAGLRAVQLLRKTKLAQGHPFMINSSALPMGQCYLEFPDGIIQLVRINRSKMDFEVVRELSHQEQSEIKKLLQVL